MLPLKVSQSCIGCGQCVLQCPTRCLMIRNGKRVYVSSENCSLCGHCYAICPVGAIEIFNIQAKQEDLDMNRLNEIETTIRYRRSIRKYDPTPIDKQQLYQLINYAKYAPSGQNLRVVKYLILGRTAMDELGQMVAEEMSKQFPKLPQQQQQLDIIFRGATNCIVAYVTMDTPFDLANKDMFNDDAVISLHQIELLAQSLGLGTFWTGMLTSQTYVSQALKQRMQLNDTDYVFGSLGIGKPALKYKRSVGRVPYHVDFME